MRKEQLENALLDLAARTHEIEDCKNEDLREARTLALFAELRMLEHSILAWREMRERVKYLGA